MKHVVVRMGFVAFAGAALSLAACEGQFGGDPPTSEHALGEAVALPQADVVPATWEETTSALQAASKLCAPCTANADCGGGANYCLRRSDGVQFCGQDCRSAACPSGYSCRRLSSTVSQCVPANLMCSSGGAGGTGGGGAGGTGGGGGAGSAGSGGAGGSGGSAGGAAAVPNTAHCAPVAAASAEWTQWENDVLALTNARRAQGATCGTTSYPAAGPLTMDPALRCAARLHSKDMFDRGYFDHTTPDGVTFDQRITAAGYQWSTLGENIAKGYPSAQAVVDGWMNSPGHCTNVMNARFTQLGVGYASGNHWTQDFGRPR